MFVDTAKKELDTNKYNSVYCVFDYDANKPNSGKKEPYERVIKNKSSYENKNIYIINSLVVLGLRTQHRRLTKYYIKN